MVSLNPELAEVWRRVCGRYLDQRVEILSSRYVVADENGGLVRQRIWQVGEEVTFRPPINPATAFGPDDRILAPRQGRLIGLFRIADSHGDDRVERILGVIASRTLGGTPRQFDVPLGDIEPNETVSHVSMPEENQSS